LYIVSSRKLTEFNGNMQSPTSSLLQTKVIDKQRYRLYVDYLYAQKSITLSRTACVWSESDTQATGTVDHTIEP